MRRELERCVEAMPVAIISGRALKDVRARANVCGISYSGNHGLELMIGRVRSVARIPVAKKTAIRSLVRALKKLEAFYPGLKVEDKSLTIAVHYRRMKKSLVPQLREDVERAVAPYLRKKLIRRSESVEAIDIVPNVPLDKGTAAKVVLASIMRSVRAHRILPICIGDSATDEDAFRALKGIGVRVGAAKHSHADYFLKSQADVEGFLRLVREARKKAIMI